MLQYLNIDDIGQLSFPPLQLLINLISSTTDTEMPIILVEQPLENSVPYNTFLFSELCHMGNLK